MSKWDWIDIQGYLELEAYSMHLDTLALFSAAALNKKQVILTFKDCYKLFFNN
jgi:hypothetical protein